MKILTTFVLSSVLALGGYRVWQQYAPQATKSTASKDSPAKANPQHPLFKPGPVANPASDNGTAVPATAAADPAAGDSVNQPLPASADAKPSAPAVEFEESELITAVEQGVIQASVRGNGRDRIVAGLRNNSPTPLRINVAAGQVLESGRNLVVVLRNTSIELMPAQSTDLLLKTAALHSANKVADAPYKLSYQDALKLLSFLKWLGDHPEVSTPAAQTAVLVLTENLPLAALAKFAPSNGTAAKFNSDAFRVDAPDLLAALSSLRDSGVKVEGFALATDPQLRIEAMIEPLSREAAKRFYNITEETEWEFWKTELLHGNPSTRHYALFGIARFYPDIALEMLPKWAREAKTHSVYRMSALQALADTQRAEALPVLRQLTEELGPDSDLGKAAAQAAGFLDQRLSQLAQPAVVAFRGKSTVNGL